MKRKSRSQNGQSPSGGGGSRGSSTPPRDWTALSLWIVAALVIGIGATLAARRFAGARSGPAPVKISGPVTFHKHVAPIVYTHCSPCHHPGEAAPFNLLNFADVKKHTRQIADVTSRRLMPPWLPEPGANEFVGERSLTEEQIQIIQAWIAQGANEGNAADAPPPPQWRDGWKLGQPDLVIRLPQPYTLPADGKDVYRNFVIPVPLSARRYVRAVEFQPGNARAVHHAFMLLDPSRDSRRRDEQDPEPGFPGLHTPPSAQTPTGHFLSWQPGKVPLPVPDELAWTLEKDTDFILQIHLRPTGKPESVQPSVGFYFTDTRPTKTPFKFGLWSYDIDIPAGEANYVIRQSYKLPVGVDVLRVLPHAHYLGRRLQGLATLPDGTQQSLIRIPRWDFNWQGDYVFAKPVFLPKGTTISMDFSYDNSTNNPANPNQPPRPVSYGVNSSDEMAELWLQVLPRNTNDAALLEKDYQPLVFNNTISYNQYLLRSDPNNAKAYTELGKACLFLGRRDEAAQHLRRAIELRPAEDEPHYFLGLLYRISNRVAEAKTEFQAALAANPNHFKAHGNLGLIHLNEGNLADAALHLESAVRINPDDEVARGGLELLSRTRGKK
jgi:hypothetical protein